MSIVFEYEGGDDERRGMATGVDAAMDGGLEESDGPEYGHHDCGDSRDVVDGHSTALVQPRITTGLDSLEFL